MLELILNDVNATKLFAKKLSLLSRPGDIITMSGELGSGKTELSRAFIRNLCGSEQIVPSPTFTLVQIYDCNPCKIWHFDFYRLDSVEEVFNLGIEDAFRDIVLIEWPKNFFDESYKKLDLFFEIISKSEKRLLSIKYNSSWKDRFLKLKEIVDEFS